METHPYCDVQDHFAVLDAQALRVVLLLSDDDRLFEPLLPNLNNDPVSGALDNRERNLAHQCFRKKRECQAVWLVNGRGFDMLKIDSIPF